GALGHGGADFFGPVGAGARAVAEVDRETFVVWQVGGDEAVKLEGAEDGCAVAGAEERALEADRGEADLEGIDERVATGVAEGIEVEIAERQALFDGGAIRLGGKDDEAIGVEA